MGLYRKGVLGPFSGKVGTVVGAVKDGKAIMRSLPLPSSAAPSQAQLEQRAKFGLVTHRMSAFTGFLRFGFRGYCSEDEAYYEAVSYGLDHAVTGTYPGYRLDFAQLLVARGKLPNALNPGASAAGSGDIKFTWTNNTGAGTAQATDKAMLVVYCPFNNQTVIVTAGAARSAQDQTLNVSQFEGQAVETWISFADVTGRHTATSIYTGNLTVT